MLFTWGKYRSKGYKAFYQRFQGEEIQQGL
jgi:hypothetical protein